MKIKIIDVPPGGAPDEVRAAWVGLELPLAEGPQPGILVGVDGAKPNPRSVGGYEVMLTDALVALKPKSPQAAAWWEEWPGNRPGRVLVFARDVCELVPEQADPQPVAQAEYVGRGGG